MRTCRTTWPAAIVVHCPKPVTLFAADSRAQLVRFLLGRRGMLTSSINEAVAFVRSDPALAAPDLELVWLPVPVLGEGLTPPPAHGVTLGVELLQPDSRGHVRLASDDPDDPPLVDPEATSPPTPTYAFCLPACVSPNGCATPLRCARTSAPPWHPGPATSTMRRWRHSSGNTPRRRSTPSAPAGWAPTTPPWSTPSYESTAWTGYGSSTPRSCRASSAATPTAPTVMIAERAADLIHANNHNPEPDPTDTN